MPPEEFEPAEFLRLARSLAANSTDEASLRSAVGRAYYAMFIIARDRLEVKYKKGVPVHQSVVIAVRKKNRRLGDELSHLKALRVKADYYLDRDNSGCAFWLEQWNRIEPELLDIYTRLIKLKP